MSIRCALGGLLRARRPIIELWYSVLCHLVTKLGYEAARWLVLWSRLLWIAHIDGRGGGRIGRARAALLVRIEYSWHTPTDLRRRLLPYVRCRRR